jgi:cytochrome c553
MKDIKDEVRTNAMANVMVSFAKALSEEEIQDLASFLSTVERE